MGQKVESGQPVSTTGYDPETDPVLARLRTHESSGGARKAVVTAAVVGLLVVGGWYAYSVYGSRSREADVGKESPAQGEAEAATPPEISPLQKAKRWCADNLAATEFAELPVVEGEDGGFFVVYTARAGDSIGSVVKRFRTSIGPDARGEALELAKRQHIERYRGRGLWVGDEIRLLIPMEPKG